MRFLGLGLAMILTSVNVMAAKPAPECEYLYERIDNINSQLRQKHGASTANRLKKEKREVRDRLRECKKKHQ